MTARIALVTDSTSNISPALAAERQIHIVPLYVIWGEETYKDGIDFEEPEFFKRLAESEEIPKTSQASPQDFVTMFETVRETEQADEIVCAVLSSDLSGTYASAMQAKEKVDIPVHVIDTRQIAPALGNILLAAADARDAGAGADDIVKIVQDTAARQNIVFTIDSLDYLRRGGRIGNAQLFVGSALRLKPVLELRDGVVESVDKVRTRKRAVDHLLKVAEDYAGGRPMTRFAVIHGDVEDEAQALLERAIAQFQPAETQLAYACTAIAVHTGPGMLGAVVEHEA